MRRVTEKNGVTTAQVVGVPQAVGQGMYVPPPTPTAPRQQGASNEVPTLPAASQNPETPATDFASTAPMPSAPISKDPIASEVFRDGESYFFTGAINGLPVRFRINEAILGIRIPTRIATAAKAVPTNVKFASKQSEIIAPISSISFGAYPIRAVMAKIYVDDDEQYVDVGTDALANFKIKSINGRRVLSGT